MGFGVGSSCVTGAGRAARVRVRNSCGKSIIATNKPQTHNKNVRERKIDTGAA